MTAHARRRREFLARLKSIDGSRPEPPDGERGDHFDNAQVTEAREQAFALHGRRVAEREALVAAIGLVDADVYGRCEDCGGEIPAKRLAAMPLTTRCRDCQETAERHEREEGGC